MADEKTHPNLLYLVHSRPLNASISLDSERAGFANLQSISQFQSLAATQHESEYPKYLTLYSLYNGEGKIDISDVPGGTESVEFRQYALVHSTSSTKRDGKATVPFLYAFAISPEEDEESEFVTWCKEDMKPALEGIPGHVETRTYKLLSHTHNRMNRLNEDERYWAGPPLYLNLHEFKDLTSVQMIPTKQWSQDINEGRRGCYAMSFKLLSSE
ncbi:hypothetical protein PV10_04461 [Exophiala mesophila]|uniref:Uncharacterized protein n=1 Tax=Exophiala mesophila TaxID=212818 RepID=A0A0D1XYB2_EXOME|nr:uncharacterized protein PV10_04461 [Exophiala mesophila]KIV93231.1 hypothetical protein PV10_04461 [Exophiala mesophila]